MKRESATKPVVSSAPFEALPDEFVSTERPAQVHDLDAVAAPRWERLPSGPGVVEIISIGSRVIVAPRDREGGLRLEVMKASLGVTWDQRRKAYLGHFSQGLRRGTMSIDSIELLLCMSGLQVTVHPDARRSAEAYREHLARQLRPIPRAVWKVEPTTARTTTGEITLGSSGRRV